MAREPDAEIIAIPATLRHNREGTVERRTSVHHEAAERTSIVHRELQAPGGRLQIAPIHRYVVVTTIDERRDSPAIGEAAIGIEQITAVTGQGCVLRDSCVVHFVIASKQRDAAGQLQRQVVASNDVTFIAGRKACVGLSRCVTMCQASYRASIWSGAANPSRQVGRNQTGCPLTALRHASR